MSAFLGVDDIDQPASAYVARRSRVEREFSDQDSGNVSWIVEAPEGRLFIKTAGTGAPRRPARRRIYHPTDREHRVL